MATRRAVASRSTKTKEAPKSVDEYLAGAPQPAKAMMMKMRTAIRSAMPAEATETISYRIPAFKLKKIAVWFAAFQNHCSLFPGAAVLAAHKDELSGYVVSKGTVQFPIAKPLPVALVKKLVKARLKEVAGMNPR